MDELLERSNKMIDKIVTIILFVLFILAIWMAFNNYNQSYNGASQEDKQVYSVYVQNTRLALCR